MFKHGKIDLRKASVEAKTSLFCMGFGQFLLGQKFKGILFLELNYFS